MKILGKTVLLTGATGGIGQAIATALAGNGATLLLSSRKEAELKALAAELPGSGHRVLVCDFAEPGAVAKLLADAGEVDILVANAALPATGRLEDFSEADIERMIRVNLEAPINLARELIEPMTERGGGHLVFTASLAGKVSSPRTSMYNATKFGLRGFAMAIREDLRETGVGVSLVSPGFIREAGMFADSGAKPPPGVGTSSPEEVAEAVVEAINEDKAEITVAPLMMKGLTRFAANFPELSAKLTRRQSTKTAEEITEGQRDKR